MAAVIMLCQSHHLKDFLQEKRQHVTEGIVRIQASFCGFTVMWSASFSRFQAIPLTISRSEGASGARLGARARSQEGTSQELICMQHTAEGKFMATARVAFIIVHVVPCGRCEQQRTKLTSGPAWWCNALLNSCVAALSGWWLRGVKGADGLAGGSARSDGQGSLTLVAG